MGISKRLWHKYKIASCDFATRELIYGKIASHKFARAYIGLNLLKILLVFRLM